MCYRRSKTPRSIRSAVPLCAVAAVIFASVAGCDLPGKPDAANKPVLPDQILDFGQLYAANCAGCHGANGTLGPAPPLNDPLFVAIIPDEELRRVIDEGRSGTPMPAFSQAKGGSLTDAQVKVLVDGIKSHWRSPTPLEQTPPTYTVSKLGAMKSTAEDHVRQMKIYQRACAGCHGPNGIGSEGTNSGPGAINVPAFLALISDQALRRIIITGRRDLGMPTYAEKRGRSADFRPLTSAEIDDLIALLAQWRAAKNIALNE
jgi:cytochrome c oxidase cbb3-type subunit 3/ubiquinol-cytochrome c reductase cytochrome c subunit